MLCNSLLSYETDYFKNVLQEENSGHQMHLRIWEKCTGWLIGGEVATDCLSDILNLPSVAIAELEQNSR